MTVPLDSPSFSRRLDQALEATLMRRTEEHRLRDTASGQMLLEELQARGLTVVLESSLADLTLKAMEEILPRFFLPVQEGSAYLAPAGKAAISRSIADAFSTALAEKGYRIVSGELDIPVRAVANYASTISIVPPAPGKPEMGPLIPEATLNALRSAMSITNNVYTPKSDYYAGYLVWALNTLGYTVSPTSPDPAEGSTPDDDGLLTHTYRDRDWRNVIVDLASDLVEGDRPGKNRSEYTQLFLDEITEAGFPTVRLMPPPNEEPDAPAPYPHTVIRDALDSAFPGNTVRQNRDAVDRVLYIFNSAGFVMLHNSDPRLAE